MASTSPNPSFPGPYRNSVPDSDPMIKRVEFTSMEVGARKSILPKNIKNDFAVQHVPNANSK